MIYIVSPYTSPLAGELALAAQKNRYMKVLEFSTFIILMGGPPAFSPIVYCHPIAVANPGIGTDAAYWQKFNMAFLRKAEAVFVLCLPGWEQSKGVKVELEVAKLLGIPVIYYDEDFQEIKPQ